MNFADLIAIAITVFVGFLGIALANYFLQKKKTTKPQWKLDIDARTEKLDGDVYAKNSSANDIKHAIIQLDALLGIAMTGVGVKGNTVGEKLKRGKFAFKDGKQYQEAWRIHKIRNKLVHEHSFSPNQKSLLSDYQKFKSIIQYLKDK